MTTDSEPKNETSLKKRYLFKLFTNLVGMGIGIGTQTIVPRTLGPAAYGDFSFLTGFFQQVVGFLNLNTSTAFYTKLSQRQQDRGIVSYYFYFTVLLGLALGLVVAVCFATGLRQSVWPGQSVVFIVLGALWAYMTFGTMVLSDMADAYGLTIRSEMAKMALKIFGFMLIVLLFWQQWLSLLGFFLYHIAFLFLTIMLLGWVVRGGGLAISDARLLPRKQLNDYTREFASFCTPLVVFTAIAVFEGILDRWFLQKYSGSVQQGFYGLAYQIGALCFLFASAMIPLVAREYAIAFGKQDIEKMSLVFMRSTPMLYAIVAYFSCFIAAESRNVMLLFGGEAYAGAVIPITIMCFFPMFQTYGQLNASIYFATNRTIAYRNIGFALTFFSLPLTFLLLGPKEYGGLQAGATGLASKMLFITFVSVNVQLWFNARLMNLSFKYLLGHQLLVAAVFSSAALACSYAVHTVLGGMHFVAQFFASGLLYTIAIAGLGLAFPSLFALRREEITNFWTGWQRK
jgi:O-antigen/teichoic acid export membrane protein